MFVVFNVSLSHFVDSAPSVEVYHARVAEDGEGIVFLHFYVKPHSIVQLRFFSTPIIQFTATLHNTGKTEIVNIFRVPGFEAWASSDYNKDGHMMKGIPCGVKLNFTVSAINLYGSTDQRNMILPEIPCPKQQRRRRNYH